MEETRGVRLFWLKVLYVYTVVVAGAVGLGALLAPEAIAAAFRMPAQDPFVLGVAGASWLAFGVVAAVGFRSPIAFSPIFLVQLCYKALWLVAVFLPQSLKGPLPFYSWVLAAVFASYVVLDLVAIPFGRLAGRRGAEALP